MNISIGQNCLNKKNPFEYIVPPSPLKWGSEQLEVLAWSVARANADDNYMF